MPDLERVDQIHQLANLLASMPPQQLGGQRIPIPQPKLAQWATELVDKFGVRVHPELGAVELVDDPDGDKMMGGNRPQRMVPRVDAERLLGMLRDIGETQHVPQLSALADKIEAAQTDEQRRLVIAEINRDNPGLIETAKRHFDTADPSSVFAADPAELFKK